MSAARESKDPASARGEVSPAGRVRARAAAPTRDDSVCDGPQRGARTLKRRANTERPTRNIGRSSCGREEAV
jgi:hypothetical protein